MGKKINYDVLSRSLAEPSRREILENLRFGQKTVSELVEATRLKQPNVSNHLARMREQGIVRAERQGRHVYYSIGMPVTELLMRLHESAVDIREEASGITGELQSGDPDAIRASEPQRFHRQPSVGEIDVDTWRIAFFQCMLDGQEDRATMIVNKMLADRLPLEVIYGDIFQWALYRIGDLYQQGETDEAHEHAASAITERMMAKVAQFYTPVYRRNLCAVLGCVAGNWHTIGLRMLTDVLSAVGWGTVYLGANVPTASFVGMVASLHPNLVVISCSLEDQIPEFRRLVTNLHARRQADSGNTFEIAAGGLELNRDAKVISELPIDFHSVDLYQFENAIREHFPPVP